MGKRLVRILSILILSNRSLGKFLSAKQSLNLKGNLDFFFFLLTLNSSLHLIKQNLYL